MTSSVMQPHISGTKELIVKLALGALATLALLLFPAIASATTPTVATTNSGNSGGNVTFTTITMPSGVSVGDLLIVGFTKDGTAAPSSISNSEWTVLSAGAAGASYQAIYWKIADGTDTLTINHDNEGTAYVAYRITGYGKNASNEPLESATAPVTGASANPNPPSLTPSYGSADTLWLTIYSWDGNNGNSAYPTNYSSNQLTDRWVQANGSGIAAATYANAAASEDPGTATLDGSDDWAAETIAIVPPLPLTLSGTVFSDQGTTETTDTLTIKAAIGTSTTGVFSTTTDSGTGDWHIDLPAGHEVDAGTPITIWVSGSTTLRASMVTKAADPTDISGLDLYQDFVIMRHEGTGTSTTITDLAGYDSSDDSDIQFTASTGSNTLTTLNGTGIYIWGGDTFAPGGLVTTNGSFVASTSATYEFPSNGTIFNATAGGNTISFATSTLIGSTTFDGVGGAWTVVGTTTVSVFRITNGSVTAPSSQLNVARDFINNGSFDDNGGLLNFSNTGGILASDWGSADSGSRVIDNGGSSNDVWDIAHASDGSIFISGDYTNGTSRWRVRKYDPNGDLDTTWGDSDTGIITVTSAGDDYQPYMTVGPNDELYVGGNVYDSTNADGDWMIRKYDANGDLDTTWGDSDTGIIDISFDASGANSDYIYDLALDESDNLYIVGMNYDSGTVGVIWKVRRYDPNGDLDTTWGDSDTGIITIGSSGSDRGIAVGLDQSGSMYTAGNFTSGQSDWMIRKYDANGDLDTTWGDSDTGIITYNPSGSDTVSDMAVTPSGEVFVGGGLGTGVDRAVKYDANGDLDTTWAESGIATWFTLGSITNLEVAPDGSLFVSGDNGSIGRIDKYDTDGVLDTSWGDDGSGQVYMPSAVDAYITVDDYGTVYAVGNVTSGDDWEIAKFDAGEATVSGSLTGSNALGDVAVAVFNTLTFGSSASTTDLTVSEYGNVVAPSQLSVAGDFTQRGTFDNNSGTVYFSGAADQAVIGNLTSTSSFANISFSGVGHKSIGDHIEVTGNYTNDAASTSVGFSTLTFNHTADATVSGSVGGNVVLSGTATTTFVNATTTNLTINAGTTAKLFGTFGVTGNFTNNGTLLAGTSTINFACDDTCAATGDFDTALAWEQVGGDSLNNSWESARDKVQVVTTDGTYIYAGLGDELDEDDEIWKYGGNVWSQIAGDGINGSWSSGYDEIQALYATGSVLYAGTGDSTSDADLWKYVDGNWTQIAGDGINGSWSTNTVVEDVIEIDGILYVGLGENAQSQNDVWQYDGATWTQIGGDSLNSGWTTTGVAYGSRILVEFNGSLHVAHGNDPNVGSSGAGDVWRWSTTTSSWTQIGGDGLNSGWAVTNYEMVPSLVSDSSYLYAGLGYTSGDAEVWRWNGTAWSKIGGDGTNSSWSGYNSVMSLAVHDNSLYAGLYGSTNGDAEVWRWNGTGWSKVGGDGLYSSWANSTYKGVASLLATDDHLYAGLDGGFSQTDRAEVWRLGVSDFEQLIDGTLTGTSSLNNVIFSGTATATVLATASTSDFTINSGALVYPATSTSIAGDYTNNGTAYFVDTGTTTFDGTSLQTATGTMSGTSALNNVIIENTSGTDAQSAPSIIFGATASSTGDLIIETPGVMAQFARGATTTWQNISLAGDGGDYVYLRSTEAGTQWNIDVLGTESVDYIYIEDSNACSSTGGNITTTNSLDSLGNNTCWDGLSASASSITISGTVYSDEGVTALTGTKNLSIAIGTTTTSVQATTTLTNGTFSFTIDDANLAAGIPLVLFLNDETEKAVTVSKLADGSSDVTGLDLYQNRVIVRHEGTGTSTTLTDMATYDATDDTDIQYDVNGGALAVSAGSELHVWAGDTFAPGGAVTVHGNAGSEPDGSLHLPAGSTYTASGNTSLAGSLQASSSAVYNFAATGLTFTATTTGKTILATSSSLGDVTFNGVGGEWSFTADATTTDFIITNGTVTAPTVSLTVEGDFTQNGVFDANGGTVYIASSSAQSLSGNLVGSNAFSTLVLQTAGAKTFAAAASTTDLTLAATAGTVEMPTLLSIAGDYTNNSTNPVDYTTNTTATYFDGASAQTATGTMIDTAAFYDLTIDNTSGNGTTSRSVTFGAAASSTGTMTVAASSSVAFTANATSSFVNVVWDGTSVTSGPVWIYSSVSGSQAAVVVTGTYTIEDAYFRDINASGSTGGGITATSSVDVLNNTGIAFASPIPTATEWNSTDWTKRVAIVIDADQVGSDLTDFPVYVDLADLPADFWATTPTTTAAVGTDIRVTTGTSTPYELPRELVSASSTAQTGELHFKADSISATTDTTFYLYYNGTTTGDYSVTATSGAQNVWTNNYDAVYHLQEEGNTTAGGYTDSTGNNNDATGVALTGASDVSGQIGSAQSLNGSTQYVTVPDIALTGALTIDAWVYRDSDSGSGVVWIGEDTGDIAGDSKLAVDAANNYFFRFVDGSTASTTGSSSVAVWKKLTVTRDSSSKVDFHENGSAATRLFSDTAQASTFTVNRIGANGQDNSQLWNGDFDEVRLSSTNRSDAWIAAEYVNQSTTTDFYTIYDNEPISLSGTFYQADRSTIYDATTSIALAVVRDGGAAIDTYSTTTDNSVFSFNTVYVDNLTASSSIVFFADNATSTAVTVQMIGTATSSLSDLVLYDRHLTLRGTSTADTIWDNVLAEYDSSDDADIPFTATADAATTLAVHSPNKLYIYDDTNFYPGGGVTIHGNGTTTVTTDGSLEIASGANYIGGSGDLELAGNFTMADNTASFVPHSTGTVFTATTSGKIIGPLYTENNFIGLDHSGDFRFDGVGGSWLLNNATTTDFTIATGTVYQTGSEFVVKGDFTQNGSYVSSADGEVFGPGEGWTTSSTTMTLYDTYEFTVGCIPNGVHVSPDGSWIFITNCNSNGEVNRHALSTPWDLTTIAAADQTYSEPSCPIGAFSNVQFREDGTTFFADCTGGARQYTLTTAWDLSTATLYDAYFLASPRAGFMYMRPDGKYYYGVSADDIVRRFKLSTPWDLTTVSYESAGIDLTSVETTVRDLAFKPDGTVMYVIGDDSNKVYRYNLSTPWDPSTAVRDSDGDFDITGEFINMRSLYVKPDGKSLYGVGFTGYDKAAQYDINESAQTISGDLTGDNSFGDVTFTGSSTKTFTANASTTDVTNESGSTLAVSPGVTLDIGGDFTQSGTLDGAYADFTFTSRQGEDISESTVTFEEAESISANTTNELALTFSSDGTRMYVADGIGTSGEEIDEYSLSIPWVATSSTYVDSLNIYSQSNDVGGIAFDPTGRFLVIADYVFDRLRSYRLSTPWDVSTGVYQGTTRSIIQEPDELEFSPDGTKLYVLGDQFDQLVEYTLGTPGDITGTFTQTSVKSLSSQSTSPQNMAFSKDGLTVYMANVNTIWKYTLSTPWDLSGLTYDSQVYSFSSEDTAGGSLELNPENTRMYILGRTGNDVNQYRINAVSQTISGTVTGGSALGDVTINGPATTTFPVNASTTDLTLNAGTTTLSATTTTIAGNFTNNAAFEHSSGTVVFSSTTAQQIATGTLSGSGGVNSFYNLTVTNTSQSGSSSQSFVLGSTTNIEGTFDLAASTSVQFPAGATTTVAVIDFSGASTSPIWLRSSKTGTEWGLDVTRQANGYVYEVNVRDSNACNGSGDYIVNLDGSDDGNNTCWTFYDGGPVWNSTDWTKYVTLTIDPNQVGSTLTDFPVYVDLADMPSYFWQNVRSDGGDIRVVAGDNTTELPRELVSASSTAFTGELHFKADSISNTDETHFFIYFGNAAATDYATFQTYGAENVWTNNYAAVWHLGEGDSTTADFYKDSTGNGYDGTLTDADGDTSAVTGQVGGAIDFAGDADEIGSFGASDSLTSFTQSVWVKAVTTHEIDAEATSGTLGLTGQKYVIFPDQGGTNAGAGISVGTNGISIYEHGSSYIPARLVYTDASGSDWQYLVNRYIKDSEMRLYRNGSSVRAKPASPRPELYGIGDATRIGGGTYGYFEGEIDEVRISSTTRSSNWIAAEYVNQSTTTDFYTVAVPGFSLAVHDAGSTENAFDGSTSETDAVLYSFKLNVNGEPQTLTDITFDFVGNGVKAADLSNIELYQDVDGDGVVDAEEGTIGGSATLSGDRQTMTVNFTSDFTLSTSSNFIVEGDVVQIGPRDYLTIGLTADNVAVTSASTSLTSIVSGTTSKSFHRTTPLSAGGGGAAIGGDAPEGDGDVGGGAPSGGSEIGAPVDGVNLADDPLFEAPTTNAQYQSENQFVAPENAYDSDGVFASTTDVDAYQLFGGFGFSIPGSDEITGITVKVDAAGTSTGVLPDLVVALSKDGGSTITAIETQANIDDPDAVYTFGGSSSLWGDTWSPSDFADPDFRVYIFGDIDTTGVVWLDALEVRVHHQATGGGPGGGGGGGI